MKKVQNSIPTTHPKPRLPILPAAQPNGEIPVPAEYRPLLIAAIQKRESNVSQIQALQERLKVLEQQVLNAHGELTGLCKAIVLGHKQDPTADWRLSEGMTHLIKR